MLTIKESLGRYRAQSNTDPNTLYQIKYWAKDDRWTCNCPWGCMGQERTGRICCHINDVLVKEGKIPLVVVYG